MFKQRAEQVYLFIVQQNRTNILSFPQKLPDARSLVKTVLFFETNYILLDISLMCKQNPVQLINENRKVSQRHVDILILFAGCSKAVQLPNEQKISKLQFPNIGNLAWINKFWFQKLLNKQTQYSTNRPLVDVKEQIGYNV